MFERIKEHRLKKEAERDYEACYLAKYLIKDFVDSYRRSPSYLPWGSRVLIYNDERDIHSEEYQKWAATPTGPVDRFSFYGYRGLSGTYIQLPDDVNCSYELNSPFIRCLKKHLEILASQSFPLSAHVTVSVKKQLVEIAGEFAEFGRETLSCVEVRMHADNMHSIDY